MRDTTPQPCPVVWPIESSADALEAQAGDLFPRYAAPRHTCKLPAGHVHWPAVGGGAGAVQPHTCHCGAWQPVRDVETTS